MSSIWSVRSEASALLDSAPDTTEKMLETVALRLSWVATSTIWSPSSSVSAPYQSPSPSALTRAAWGICVPGGSPSSSGASPTMISCLNGFNSGLSVIESQSESGIGGNWEASTRPVTGSRSALASNAAC